MPNAVEANHGGLRRLVLIRHAETAENAAGRFLGRSDPPLTPDASDAAARHALSIGATGQSRVVSSPARRAQQTARCLGLGTWVNDDAFSEVDFGQWEGLTREQAAARSPEDFAAFEAGDIDGFPGGERIDAARERTVAAVQRHMAEVNGSDRLVVVTHATIIRLLVAGLLGLPVNRYRALLARPGHLSWTELEAVHDGWMLVTYGAPLAVMDVVFAPGTGAS